MDLKRTPGDFHAKPHRLDPESYRGEIAVAFTACVAGRVKLFEDPPAVQGVAGLLRRTAALYSLSMPIYCFMADHLHAVFLGETPDADTWKAMVSFKQHSGYWLRLNHPGVRWQKGFYDHVLRSQESLASQVKYIAENPVRKGLATEWDAYPYTGSYGFDLRALIEGVALG